MWARNKTRRAKKTYLELEALETRQVMSHSEAGLAPVLADHGLGEALSTSLLDGALVQAVDLQTLDLTSVAQQFPPHAGPTTLYLNFDGWDHYDADPVWGCLFGCNSMSAFAGTTGHRESDIQEILFRTSEMFAPFNVQVRRIFGDGDHSHSNGNSTVFIGDDSAVTNAHGYTPWRHVDAPIRKRQWSVDVEVNPDGTFETNYVYADHKPNSDAWNIARVDPVHNSNPADNWTNNKIARVVAHEAGHTFGLLHTRTVGADPAALDNTDTHLNPPEVMAYDSGSSYEYFRNETFNITLFNNSGGTTYLEEGLTAEWDGKAITRQNSYTYLQAVLGGRSSDDAANVAHRNYAAGLALVDTAYADSTLKNVGPGTTITDAVDRPGDYDVYQLGAVTGTNYALSINVTPATGSTVDPVIMIFDDANGNLVAYNNDRSTGNPASGLTFQRSLGRTYKLVVGAVNGASTGYFRLSVVNFVPKTYRSGSLSGMTFTQTMSISQTTATSSSLSIGIGSGEDDQPVEQRMVLTPRMPSKSAPAALHSKAVDRVMTALDTSLAEDWEKNNLFKPSRARGR